MWSNVKKETGPVQPLLLGPSWLSCAFPFNIACQCHVWTNFFYCLTIIMPSCCVRLRLSGAHSMLSRAEQLSPGQSAKCSTLSGPSGIWYSILHQFTGHLYIDAACTNRQFCDSTFEKDDFKLSMKYAKFLFIPHNDHIHSQNVDSPTAVIFKERPLLLPSDALPKITTIVTWCVSMCFIFHLCVACIGRLMWSQRLNAERTDNAHGAMQL